jgi:hypothetical protein
MQHHTCVSNRGAQAWVRSAGCRHADADSCSPLGINRFNSVCCSGSRGEAGGGADAAGFCEPASHVLCRAPEQDVRCVRMASLRTMLLDTTLLLLMLAACITWTLVAPPRLPPTSGAGLQCHTILPWWAGRCWTTCRADKKYFVPYCLASLCSLTPGRATGCSLRGQWLRLAVVCGLRRDCRHLRAIPSE